MPTPSRVQWLVAGPAKTKPAASSKFPAALQRADGATDGSQQRPALASTSCCPPRRSSVGSGEGSHVVHTAVAPVGEAADLAATLKERQRARSCPNNASLHDPSVHFHQLSGDLLCKRFGLLAQYRRKGAILLLEDRAPCTSVRAVPAHLHERLPRPKACSVQLRLHGPSVARVPQLTPTAEGKRCADLP